MLGSNFVILLVLVLQFINYSIGNSKNAKNSTTVFKVSLVSTLGGRSHAIHGVKVAYLLQSSGKYNVTFISYNDILTIADNYQINQLSLGDNPIQLEYSRQINLT